MAENILVDKNSSISQQYAQLIPQLNALLDLPAGPVANLGNIAAVLHYSFGFLWTGFYMVKGQQLVLGPFQGPVACTTISHNKGVCGQAWAKGEAIVVPNVHEYPGHIACSSASNSEMVIPIKHNGEVQLVLDVDSEQFNCFNEEHVKGLTQVSQLIATNLLPLLI